jgi:flagellar basal-body rod protein FlgG
MDGLHAAASGLFAQQARMDSIANDIANVSTAGYQKDRLAFSDLIDRSGTQVIEAGRSFQPGPLLQSDNPLALAIQGPGFFQIRLGDGRVALTRAGDFRLDANGEIVTNGGERLVPPIKLPQGASPSDVSVSAEGIVTAGGTQIGKLELVDVPARAGLRPVGGGRYVATAASGAAVPVTSSPVSQGVLEGSNVDLGDAMVDLIDAQRSFSLASRVVKTQDELLEIANGIRR